MHVELRWNNRGSFGGSKRHGASRGAGRCGSKQTEQGNWCRTFWPRMKREENKARVTLCLLWPSERCPLPRLSKDSDWARKCSHAHTHTLHLHALEHITVTQRELHTCAHTLTHTHAQTQSVRDAFQREQEGRSIAIRKAQWGCVSLSSL